MSRARSHTPRFDPPSAPDLADSEASNFMRLLANSPQVREAYESYEQALSRGVLSAQERELIALVVAEINGSKYGLSAHYAAATNLGLTAEDIRLAREASAAEPKRRAMLQFTRAVALQRGEVSDQDFQSLRQAGYSDAEATEIVANVALNIFRNYFNNVARTAIDYPILQPGNDAPTLPSSRRWPVPKADSA